MKFYILSFLFSINLFSFPFVKNKDEIYFKESNFGYSNPSLFYLNVDEIDYANLSFGYLWYKNYYFSSFETTIMGNNLAPWKDGNQNIDSVAVQILNAGYLFDFKYIDFFVSLSGGLLNINKSSFLTEEIKQSNRGYYFTTNISMGIFSNFKKFSIKFAATQEKAGAIEGLTTILFDFNYKIFNKIKIGTFYQAAIRSFELCSDLQSDKCDYHFLLSQISLYLSYNFTKDYWFLLGFVVSSQTERIINGEISNERKPVLFPFYISID